LPDGMSTRMCVLASRDHLCVHPQVSKSSGKTEECMRLLGETAHGGAGCPYYKNMRSLLFHPSLKPHGQLTVWDIEDIVKLGKKTKGCAYFAAREMMEAADIVFCPYNYLIEPAIRESLGVDVSNAVIVIDEVSGMS
jgi:Fanconi anemia group J protein